MPRVPNEWVDTVAYLYPSVDAAREGEGSGGCGVLLGVPYRGPAFDQWTLSHVVVVTNAHVAATCKVARVNGWTGPLVIDLAEPYAHGAPRWYPHPDGDDIVVGSISSNVLFDDRVAILPREMLISPKFLVKNLVGYGDELFMASRFIAHDGRQENEPVVRFGTLAKPKPVLVRNTHTGINQESFLAEMRSLPGHSGSPAFIYFTGLQLRLGVERDVKAQVRLLGIDWGHLHREAKVLDQYGEPVADKLVVEENTGMACIVPAWKIKDILATQEFIDLHQHLEELVAEILEPPETGASLDAAEELSTVSKTADLMGDLLQVPKDEADEVHREHGSES